MGQNFPLFPEQASSFAQGVDNLYFFLLAVTSFFSLLIASLLVFFALRYRRRSDSEVPRPIEGSVLLEVIWTVIPLFITLVIFYWGASIFFTLNRPPDDAMDIRVVGKQWMWKLQHLQGQREINELHVPVNHNVKLTMASEDVIHSFYIPAFRIKADVVPGRFSMAWFRAIKTGTYHLFCAEYCGTKHSQMVGKIIVLEPAEFQNWLSGGAGGESLAERGRKLFQSLACHTCHLTDGTGRGPRLEGIYGSRVALQDGSTVIADENYLREAILNPSKRLAVGYQPIMPTFQGLISEEGLMEVLAYVQSLAAPAGAPASPGAAGSSEPGVKK